MFSNLLLQISRQLLLQQPFSECFSIDACCNLQTQSASTLSLIPFHDLLYTESCFYSCATYCNCSSSVSTSSHPCHSLSPLPPFNSSPHISFSMPPYYSPLCSSPSASLLLTSVSASPSHYSHLPTFESSSHSAASHWATACTWHCPSPWVCPSHLWAPRSHASSAVSPPAYHRSRAPPQATSLLDSCSPRASGPCPPWSYLAAPASPTRYALSPPGSSPRASPCARARHRCPARRCPNECA